MAMSVFHSGQELNDQESEFSRTAQDAGQIQERTVPVISGTSGRVRAEDVLAHVEGGVDEMSDEEAVENAALAERHEELLRAHGYRLVRLACVLCLFTCYFIAWQAPFSQQLVCSSALMS